jgi:hypothetical protein
VAQINFRRLFRIPFTALMLILVFIFAIIAVAERLTVITPTIMITIPLVIRYVFYTYFNQNLKQSMVYGNYFSLVQ